MKVLGAVVVIATAFIILTGMVHTELNDAPNQIVASFDRMLAHEPGGLTAVNTTRETDVLQETIAAVLWTEQPRQPVVASYQRMLEHEPTKISRMPNLAEPDTMEQMFRATLWTPPAPEARLVAISK